MQTHNLGYPRIGNNRELKKASERYWAGKISVEELIETGKDIRLNNWQLQKEAGIDLIPSNDFSFYDQVLDTTLAVGAIPERYQPILEKESKNKLDLYFAMARGFQKDGLDITAMELTKWFDTNYHYIVPEFQKDQKFELYSDKIETEFVEAKEAGVITKPVLIGPVSYLLLGKEKDADFDRLDLVENLLPVYIELIKKLKAQGVEHIQFDEPFLALDISEKAKTAFNYVYTEIKEQFPELKSIITTYFEGLKDNLELASSLPVWALHVDLVRHPEQLEEVLEAFPQDKKLSLGVVDGRNIWKNDYQETLKLISKAIAKIKAERILIAPSCSLLHVPCDLDLETDEEALTPEIKQWLAFAKQKLEEVVTLKKLANPEEHKEVADKLEANQNAIESRRVSELIHNQKVKNRVEGITEKDTKRKSAFAERRDKQHEKLNLPLFPTTTIGSFPQTSDVRKQRSKYRRGKIDKKEYDDFLKEETEKTVRWQEEIGIDVLVHGEFERNDMVEYFGEQLDGVVFTKKAWVQSYGSRYVKPPIIYGDIQRPNPMTVHWSAYAQSLTDNPVKGMLTGPVTLLEWSFVRNDQPHSETCTQLALAIRDEVLDLEEAGISVIQIDEPALREGLPLRKADWQDYLKWAVRAFKIASSGVQDDTQIHTHMCYSEFNDIIEDIADLDADVITLECSRSQMELLDAFAEFEYPNEIGPGVYDIHSPRVPAKEELTHLLEKASAVIDPKQLWVNPDCGLKTRHWEETKKSLEVLVSAARELRETSKEPVAL